MQLAAAQGAAMPNVGPLSPQPLHSARSVLLVLSQSMTVGNRWWQWRWQLLTASKRTILGHSDAGGKTHSKVAWLAAHRAPSHTVLRPDLRLVRIPYKNQEGRKHVTQLSNNNWHCLANWCHSDDYKKVWFSLHTKMSKEMLSPQPRK